MEKLLELEDISKRYGNVLANDSVSLAVAPGEIHALLGENGAGKSTLMKVLTGLVKPDTGCVKWRGKEVTIDNPQAAKRLGIAMVHQHFALFDGMTTLENIALGLEGKKPNKAFRDEVMATAKAYKLNIHPDQRVFQLSAGEKQRIEIVRALMANPELLVLDEPTSVLTPQEADDLFSSLRTMRDEGRGLIFISHKLDEVRALCTGATILRGGKMVGHCDPREESAESLAELMIGQRMTGVSKPNAVRDDAPIVLRAHVRTPDLEINNLEVRAGEILGVAGVAGNGQDALFAFLSGETLAPQNSLNMAGKDVSELGPNQRRELSMAFVPEERLGHAAVVSMSLSDNILLTGIHDKALHNRGLISWSGMREWADRITEAFNVRHPGIGSPAGSLSGGNLQKYVVGRDLLRKPKLFVVNQPTWGVDMGAAQHIRRAMIELAEKEGAAIVAISQDLDELFEISDRIAVLHAGELLDARPTKDWTSETIGLAMAGSESAHSGKEAA